MEKILVIIEKDTISDEVFKELFLSLGLYYYYLYGNKLDSNYFYIFPTSNKLLLESNKDIFYTSSKGLDIPPYLKKFNNLTLTPPQIEDYLSLYKLLDISLYNYIINN